MENNNSLHLLFPFPIPEEDGYAGILLILSKKQSHLLAEAIRDASLLMTNREYFATKAQWLHFDVNQNCEEAILIDNTPDGIGFVNINFHSDWSRPFFIENVSHAKSVQSEDHPEDYDWSVFIGTVYGGGVPHLQLLLESNVGTGRVNGYKINTNQFEVEEFLNSLERSLNEDYFPEQIDDE